MQVAAGCSAVLVIVFFWEHIGRLNHWTVKPSKFLEYTIWLSEKTWEHAGKLLAHISGVAETVYEFVSRHFQGLAETLEVFLNLFLRYLEAPTNLVIGYWNTLHTYTNKSMVYLGTLLIATTLGWLGYIYHTTILKFVQPVVTILSSPRDMNIFHIAIITIIAFRLLGVLLTLVSHIINAVAKAVESNKPPSQQHNARSRQRSATPRKRVRIPSTGEDADAPESN